MSFFLLPGRVSLPGDRWLAGQCAAKTDSPSKSAENETENENAGDMLRKRSFEASKKSQRSFGANKKAGTRFDGVPALFVL